MLASAFLALASGACRDRAALDREALMDPATCESCHPEHVEQWAGSMHAYSSDDPVFIALNQKLQEDTDGAFAGFCVGCHAPMALRTGATVDGTNLEDVPRHLRGVTCYFCHTIDRVDGEFNGALHIAGDGVMRGPHRNPLETEAHASAYSPLMDGQARESSSMCGACHDVVNPAGVEIERTFAEWKESLFGQVGPQSLSCNRCHMPGRTGLSAEIPGAPERRIHEHAWPGIDVALTPWPGIDDQLAGIERDLQPSVMLTLCVSPAAGGATIEVTLDNLFAGHAWPSGVTHARRAWVEIEAWNGDERIFASGVVDDGQPAVEATGEPWIMRSHMYDEAGQEVHVPWLAASIESNLLPPAVTSDPTDPAFFHAVTRTFDVEDAAPDRVTTRLKIRPVGLEMIDGLIAEGRLDPAVRDAVPTFELEPARREWTDTEGFGCVPE